MTASVQHKEAECRATQSHYVPHEQLRFKSPSKWSGRAGIDPGGGGGGWGVWGWGVEEVRGGGGGVEVIHWGTQMGAGEREGGRSVGVRETESKFRKGIGCVCIDWLTSCVVSVRMM